LDLRLFPGQFEDRGMIGPYRLLRMPEIQRYRLVTHAIFVSDKDAARRELDHPDFDPLRMVVVETPDRVVVAPETAAPCTANVLEESNRSVTLLTSCLLPGWVVTNKPYIPGWKAIVDGVEVSPIRANEAFLAVPVPAGAKRVELHYDPRSVRLGAWLSILGLLLTVLLWRGRSLPAA
ncbi:MAG: YfhO family protein, partial [Planctomycetia bacterium]